MIVKTARELCINALQQKLQLYRPGIAPSASHIAACREEWDNLHAELVDEGIAYWDADEIPHAVFTRCAWLLAIEVAPSYGALPIVLQSIEQPSGEAAKGFIRARLRDHVAQTETHETVQGEYF